MEQMLKPHKSDEYPEGQYACANCGEKVTQVRDVFINGFFGWYKSVDKLPRCPHCGMKVDWTEIITGAPIVKYPPEKEEDTNYEKELMS